MIRCLLCQGRVKSVDRYENHLREEHESSTGRDLVIAVTFLNDVEKEVLMKRGEESKKQIIEEKTLRITSQLVFPNMIKIKNIETIGIQEGPLNNDVDDSIDSKNSIMSETLEGEMEVIANSLYETANTVEKNGNTYISNKDTENQEHEGDTSRPSKDAADLECKLCSTLISNRPNLVRQVKTVHKEDQHLLSHPGQSSFSCHICPKLTQTEILLQIHVKRNHPEEDRGSIRFKEQLADIDKNNEIKCKVSSGGVCNKTVGLQPSNVTTALEKDPFDDSETIDISDDETILVGMSYLPEESKDCSPSRLVASNVDDLDVKHVKSEFVADEFICRLCYSGFSSDSDLDSHDKLFHNNEEREVGKNFSVENLIYTCDICDLKFVTENSVLVHKSLQHRLKLKTILQINAARRSVECLICRVQFDRQKNLDNHSNSYHSSKIDTLEYLSKNFKMSHCCSQCGEAFYTERSLAFHSNVIHKKDDTYCILCNIKFKNPIGLYMHKLKIHIDELQAFNLKYQEEDFVHKCSYCDKQFPTEGSVSHHMNRKHYVLHHYGSKLENKNLQNNRKHCKLCDITFKKKTGFEIHKQKIHKDELDAFERELLSEELKQQCLLCSTMFYSLNSLRCHISRVHKDYQGYCNLCHVTFKRETYYIKHLNNVHKLDKETNAIKLDLERFSVTKQCHHCDKTFLNKKNMAFHLKYAHTGLPRRLSDTSCKYCKKIFKAGKNMNRTLKRHMKTVHNVDGLDDIEFDGEQNVHKHFLALLNLQQTC